MTIDPGWVESNIVTIDVPGVGRLRCHRLVAAELRRALIEADPKNAAPAIAFDPQVASPSSGLSRHAWGIGLTLHPAADAADISAARSRSSRTPGSHGAACGSTAVPTTTNGSGPAFANGPYGRIRMRFAALSRTGHGAGGGVPKGASACASAALSRTGTAAAAAVPLWSHTHALRCSGSHGARLLRLRFLWSHPHALRRSVSHGARLLRLRFLWSHPHALRRSVSHGARLLRLLRLSS